MADPSPLLSVPELARRLGVSETTVHNWRKAFGDLIASVVGLDGIRRYPLDPFVRIAALREQRLPRAAIRAALEQGEPAPTTTAGPTFEERLLTVLERIAVALERLTDHLAPGPGRE